jgi:hypothetical protein
MDHEVAEQIEHAAHEGAHQGGLARHIGMTIAVLGVLLALCSALLGGARTELIATMVEETGTTLKYQSVSTKYRMLQAQLQQLHALMPDQKSLDANESELKALESSVTNAEMSRVIKTVRLETQKILNTVTPNRSDVLRFARLVRRYDKERVAARTWAESYKDEIKVHAHSVERYEAGQLAAEIGIVIASIALLLSNRKAWLAAILLGLLSLGAAGGTYLMTSRALHEAETKVEQSHEKFAEIAGDKSDLEDDEKLLGDIERESPKP